MKQTFDNCSSQFVWDNNEGYVPTDARNLQNFQHLTKECDILFNNAERFLAKHICLNHCAYQLEIDDPPFEFDGNRTGRLREHLCQRSVLSTFRRMPLVGRQ